MNGYSYSECALARLKLQMDNMNQNLQEYVFKAPEPTEEAKRNADRLREQIEERLKMLEER